MYFNPTPANITALLVISLAAVGVFFLLRKRYDTNIPLIFYFFALVFTNLADRPVDPYIMYGGLGFALLLRFEFMSAGFTKFIALCAAGGLCITAWAMLSESMKY